MQMSLTEWDRHIGNGRKRQLAVNCDAMIQACILVKHLRTKPFPPTVKLHINAENNPILSSDSTKEAILYRCSMVFHQYSLRFRSSLSKYEPYGKILLFISLETCCLELTWVNTPNGNVLLVKRSTLLKSILLYLMYSSQTTLRL